MSAATTNTLQETSSQTLIPALVCVELQVGRQWTKPLWGMWRGDPILNLHLHLKPISLCLYLACCVFSLDIIIMFKNLSLQWNSLRVEPPSPPWKSMSPCLQGIYQQIKISNWYINLSRFTLWLICSIKETTYSACFALPIRSNTPTEKLCIKVLQIKSKCCKSLFVLHGLKIRRFHLHIFTSYLPVSDNSISF